MTDPQRSWLVRTIENRCCREEHRELIQENIIPIEIGGQVVTELLATPCCEIELAAGWVLTMGYGDVSGEPPLIEFDPQEKILRVSGNIKCLQESGPKASSGGNLGPLTVLPPDSPCRFELSHVVGFTKQMSRCQELFKKTGAAHAASIFDEQGRMLTVAEDVGRHNALDKAVGRLWLDGQLSKARAIALSGRISLEMVLKSARSGIGTVVGVSAPTAQAVACAESLEMTLFGFSRGDNATLYTSPFHVNIDPANDHLFDI